MTPLENDVAEPPASLTEDGRQLWEAVAPTLARVEMLQPQYVFALELLVASAGAYFALRRAPVDNAIDPVDFEFELGAPRRQVLGMCSRWGLGLEPPAVADAIDVRVQETWLARLFEIEDLPALVGRGSVLQENRAARPSPAVVGRSASVPSPGCGQSRGHGGHTLRRGRNETRD